MELHLTAAECHLQYGITQCVTFQPTQVNTPRLNSSQTGQYLRFTYPGGMESLVDLGDWLHTETVYPPTDGHPSKY